MIHQSGGQRDSLQVPCWPKQCVCGPIRTDGPPPPQEGALSPELLKASQLHGGLDWAFRVKPPVRSKSICHPQLNLVVTGRPTGRGGTAAHLPPLQRASELAPSTAGRGADRFLPVLAELRDLFPDGGLRRGSTVAISASRGAVTLMLATLTAASSAGSWCAVVGMPQLGLVAAAEMGIDLQRLALVPRPGSQWTNAVSILLDGFDIVVIAPAGPVAASVRTQLAARTRQRCAVLVPFGEWDGADLTLTPERSVWHGLGRGKGRLRQRELTVCARGRGAATRPRRVTTWLPGPDPAAEQPGRRHGTGRRCPSSEYT